MAFTDLPPDWPTRPITDPALLADVLDLVVSEHARVTGSLFLLLCDPGDRLVLPVEIGELATAPAGSARAEMLAPIMRQADEMEPDGGVLAAIARPGGLSVTADDLAWADTVADAARGRLRLLGVHVITLDGSRPVPADRRAA
ncbi:MAG: hypothetical protein WCA29_07540 [Jiangellales bacterium]